MTKFTSLVAASILVFGVAVTTTIAANAQTPQAKNTANNSLQAGLRGGRKSSEIFDAVKNNNYNAFVSALGKLSDPQAEKLKKVIENESDFAIFVEAHEAKKNNDIATFDAKMTELGLPTSAQREEKRAEMKAIRTEIAAAITASDYEKFKELVAKTPRGEKILNKIKTQEDFEKLQEKHAARKQRQLNRKEHPENQSENAERPEKNGQFESRRGNR